MQRATQRRLSVPAMFKVWPPDYKVWPLKAVRHWVGCAEMSVSQMCCIGFQMSSCTCVLTLCQLARLQMLNAGSAGSIHGQQRHPIVAA